MYDKNKMLEVMSYAKIDPHIPYHPRLLSIHLPRYHFHPNKAKALSAGYRKDGKRMRTGKKQANSRKIDQYRIAVDHFRTRKTMGRECLFEKCDIAWKGLEKGRSGRVGDEKYPKGLPFLWG